MTDVAQAAMSKHELTDEKITAVTFKSLLIDQLKADPALDVLRKRMDAKRNEMNDYMSLANDIEGRINGRNLQIDLLNGENEEDERQRRAVHVLQASARDEVVKLENAIQDFN